ncbi:prenyltransferase/squalene oxidase repeat-containing protein [Niabella insulamsoli]|uniref:prenyltransferase/squalene oxidase repeat-containing protein n=1 Tax=Niabella insulamsoli TaxID=3144874 RepID=UPI0031FDAB28
MIQQENTFAQPDARQAVLNYVASLAKPDGGYGWASQPDGHITPTFALVGVLLNLKALPKDRSPLITWVRTHHPQTGLNKEAGPSGSQMRDLAFQQMQAIAWLGGRLDDYKKEVAQWKSQKKSIANYEEMGFGNFWQESFTPLAFQLLNLPLDSVQKQFLPYLSGLRRKNGSYNNAPPGFYSGDGNILCTLHAIRALIAFDQDTPQKQELIHWLQNCQKEDGGFVHQPQPELARKTDIIYAWAAVSALHLLGTQPLQVNSCVQYILSLQNADGGFGSKPGLASTPMSTYYAIDALRILKSLNALDKPLISGAPPKKKENWEGQNLFTVQFQAVGAGSPKEAVWLANYFKIDLWGAKNAPDGWIAAAQRIADQQKVPVHFFITDEPYHKSVIVPGMGKFGHILDYFSKAGYPVLFPKEASWPVLHKNYMAPLLKNDGGLILQVSNNEPLARILLDESIDNGGYVAMATHHFDQNFAFWLPYLFDYESRLPMVCLQDGHGIESWWWADELQKERTLFIAKEATYHSMVAAIRKNHVVSVKHDSVTHYKTRMMGAGLEVRDFISRNKKGWRWWADDGSVEDQPWGIITAVFAGDRFETAAPSTGVAIRVRRWYKTRQQFLLQPVTQLVSLSIDGKLVEAPSFEFKNQKGQLQDAYYLYTMQGVSPGKHEVEAVFQKLENGAKKVIKTSFHVE